MANRIVAFQSMVFRRSDHNIVAGDPAFPSGGSYASPIPDNAYWSRIPLPGNDPLYVSMRVFTSDGLSPHEELWSPPVLFIKHGDKGDTGNSGDIGANGTHGLNGIGTPGAPGVNGADGIDGRGIIWVGETTSHPINPVYGAAYYNTTDRKSYIYYDSTWGQMTVDGVDGTNGTNGVDGANGANGIDGVDGTSPVYSKIGTARSIPHTVESSVTLVAGTATVTLTGAAVFTSATSYTVITSRNSMNTIAVNQTSGSSFTLTSSNLADTDIVRFIAIGD